MEPVPPPPDSRRRIDEVVKPVPAAAPPPPPAAAPTQGPPPPVPAAPVVAPPAAPGRVASSDAETITTPLGSGSSGWGAPAPQPGHAGASAGSRTPIVVTAAIVGLVILGAGGAWAAGLGPFGSGSPGPSATTAADLPTASPTPRVTPTPEVTASPRITPPPETTDPGGAATPVPVYGNGADVATLIGLAPDAIADSCTSAQLIGLEVAAVQCTASGVNGVFYELYVAAGDMQSDWATLLERHSLVKDEGSCSASSPGENSWHYTTDGVDGPDEGRLACYLEDDAPTLLWTDETTMTRGWLLGDKGDELAPLYTRWAKGDLHPDRPSD